MTEDELKRESKDLVDLVHLPTSQPLTVGIRNLAKRYAVSKLLHFKDRMVNMPFTKVNSDVVHADEIDRVAEEIDQCIKEINHE